MSDASKPRVAFLHETTYSPDQRIHMIVLIEDILKASGIEVVHLVSTDHYIPADLLFVHVDRSIVSPEARSFALHYPNAINAYATDIRKARYIDGLLGRNDAHDGPVIVKTDLNYAGQPERNSQNRVRTIPRRLIARAMRLLGATDYTIRTKSDYRIYDSLAEVPRHYFGEDYVVQKFMPERDGAKNVLREYIFLGDLHYENIERSSDLIITEDEHVSCKPFVPHPRLLALRRQLGLQYGKIDYTMVDGEPFIFDANKTLGLGEYGDTTWLAPDVHGMLVGFAEELIRLIESSRTEPEAYAQSLLVG